MKCDRDDNNAKNVTWDFLKDMADGGELYYGDHVPTLGEVRGKMYLFSRLDFGETTQKDKCNIYDEFQQINTVIGTGLCSKAQAGFLSPENFFQLF